MIALSFFPWEQAPRVIDFLLILLLWRIARILTAEKGKDDLASAKGIDARRMSGEASEREAGLTDLPNVGRGDESSQNGREFVMHSLFLWHSYRLVCKSGPKECFHYCTGLHVSGRFVITDVVPVNFASRSLGHVRVDDGSSIRALEALDGWGLPLLAHVHSHPGCGAEATLPSPTDKRFLKTLAKGGHIAIGLIFARDGYFRVFADSSLSFRLTLVGNHVEQIGPDVYRLSAVAGEHLSVGVA